MALLVLLLRLTGASQKDVNMNLKKEWEREEKKKSKLISDLVAFDRCTQSAVFTDNINSVV